MSSVGNASSGILCSPPSNGVGYCRTQAILLVSHSGSLLHDAVVRANFVTSPERTTVVVAEHHRRWWEGLDLRVPARNLFSQPSNRGTAQGILLPLLRILHREPEASLLILPSDHYVSNELVLAAGLREAMTEVIWTPEGILLLGMAAEEADPELGYIVTDGVADVSAVAILWRSLMSLQRVR